MVQGPERFARNRGIVRVKILVCVKQVPDSGETLSIDASSGWIDYGRSTVFRMNRYDEFALEEALLIRESLPGTVVHALSAGPERVGSTLRRTLEMGADHAIHILDGRESYVSPISVASLIASCARTRGYDLILAGVMAEDDMACQVGQLVAALLDLPCATSVIRGEVCPGGSEILVEREIEGGCRQEVLLRTPAVLTIQPGIHTPRYPSLSHVLRARSQPQEIIDSRALGIPGQQESAGRLRAPDLTSQGIFLEGSSREKARALVGILHEKALLIQR